MLPTVRTAPAVLSGRNKQKPALGNPASKGNDKVGNEDQAGHPTQAEGSGRALGGTAPERVSNAVQGWMDEPHVGGSAQANAIRRLPSEPSIPVPFVMGPGGWHPNTTRGAEALAKQLPFGGGGSQSTRKRRLHVPHRASDDQLEFLATNLRPEQLIVKADLAYNVLLKGSHIGFFPLQFITELRPDLRRLISLPAPALLPRRLLKKQQASL